MVTLLLLLLPLQAHALYSDNVAEQARNVIQISDAQTARYATYRATNCAGNIRGVNFGHSISMGQISGGAVNDGYRRNLTPALADKGFFINWVGYQVGGATTVLQCPATNLPGASPTMQMIYTNLTTVVEAELVSPTANDWVFIGPALTNSATLGVSQANMQAQLAAAITFTAQKRPLAKIFVANDIARNDGVSLTTALAAANYAFTWSKAQGCNVYFLDINSCTVQIGTDNLHQSS